MPVMRPLLLDFPEDERCWDVDDQFLFGPDLLVAPVLEQHASERSVYFPAGTEWTDVWTRAREPGGAVVTVPAPLERIPLFLRAGAQLDIALFALAVHRTRIGVTVKARFDDRRHSLVRVVGRRRASLAFWPTKDDGIEQRGARARSLQAR